MFWEQLSKSHRYVKSLFSVIQCIHYSAGIGRTGTFIVIDYLIRQAKAESHLDVFRTVTDMRYQRANFVQTDVSCVILALSKSPKSFETRNNG